MPLREIIIVSILFLGPQQSTLLGATPELTLDDIRAGKLRLGETSRVTGKYMGRVDLELQVHDIPLSFILSDVSLGRSLLSYKPNVDNLVLEGTVRKANAEQGEKLPVFKVEKISAGPTDVEYFRHWIDRTTRDPSASGARLLTLGERIYQFFVTFQNDALYPLLRETVKGSLERSLRESDIRDAKSTLRLVESGIKRVPAPGLLGEILAEVAADYPESPEIRDRLLEVGYRKRNGRWLDKDEFKSQEGFLWDGTRWVKAADHEFALVLSVLGKENLTNLILRSRTTREYKDLAKSGDIARGMTRAEIARAAGFPNRVRRKQIRKVDIDQWDYADFRIYFVDGHSLFLWTPPVEEEGVKALEGLAKKAAQAVEGNDKKRRRNP